jgi:hypothetical protein
MSNAIRCARERKQQIDAPTGESLLIQAYLNKTPPLHPRRTLDQFFYHGIDTSARDVDQYAQMTSLSSFQEPLGSLLLHIPKIWFGITIVL